MLCDCPACGAECDSGGLSAAAARCPRCGQTFWPPPPPPDVIYGSPPPAASAENHSIAAPLREPPPAGRPRPGAPPIAAPEEPLGLPPPYRPIQPPRKTPPPRLVIAMPPPVRTAATPVNFRGTGALGPPPPYRSIGPAAPAFGRGPPPDLEPLREEALVRPMPVLRREAPPPRPAQVESDTESALPEWSIRREQPAALRSGPDRELQDRPVRALVPPLTPEPPTGLDPRAVPSDSYDSPDAFAPERAARRRWFWPALLIALAVLGTAGTGAGLYLGRWHVMKTFPQTRPIYKSLGLGLSPAPPPAQRPPPR